MYPAPEMVMTAKPAVCRLSWALNWVDARRRSRLAKRNVVETAVHHDLHGEAIEKLVGIDQMMVLATGGVVLVRRRATRPRWSIAAGIGGGKCHCT